MSSDNPQSPVDPPAHVREPLRQRRGWRIIQMVLVILLLPLLAIQFIFPLFTSQPFNSVDELDPNEIKWLKVSVFNRDDLDGGDDVGPYYADPDDFDQLLKPLRGLIEVEPFTDARGPWLGEYRVMLKNGRRNTIRLYWHSAPDPSLPPDAPVWIRMQIGRHYFQGGTVRALLEATTDAEPRGKQNP